MLIAALPNAQPSANKRKRSDFLTRRCPSQDYVPRVRNFPLIVAINRPCERNRTQDRGKRDPLRKDGQWLGTTWAASNREVWAVDSGFCYCFAP